MKVYILFLWILFVGRATAFRRATAYPLFPSILYRLRLNPLYAKRVHVNKYANMTSSSTLKHLKPPEIPIPIPIANAHVPTTSGTTIPDVSNGAFDMVTSGRRNRTVIGQTANLSDLGKGISLTSDDVTGQSPSNGLPSFDVTAVNPSDPYTFGYVQLGFVRRPHGVKGDVKITLNTLDSQYRFGAGSVLYLKRSHRRAPRPIRVESCLATTGSDLLVKFQGFKSRNQALIISGCVVYARTDVRPSLHSNEYLLRDLVGSLCLEQVEAQKNLSTPQNCTSKPSGFRVFGQVAGVVPSTSFCGHSSVANIMHDLLELRLFSEPYSLIEIADEANPSESKSNRTVNVKSESWLQSGSNHERYQEEDDFMSDFCLVPMVSAIVKQVDVTRGILVIEPPSGLLSLTYRKSRKKVVMRGFLPSRITRLTDTERLCLMFLCQPL